MPGTQTYTPIPSSPKQPAAAATFNSRFNEIVSGTTGVTGHYNGAFARHLVSEIDSATTDDHAVAVALSVGATDQHSRNLQLLTLIGQLANSASSATDAFAKVAGLVSSGIDLNRVGAAVNGRTPNTVAGAIVSRGTNGEFGAGYISAWGFGAVNATEFSARPVAGQTAPVIAVQNAAGTANKWLVDGAGNSVQSANATVQGVVLAGTGGIQITTAAGNLDATKIVNTLPTAATAALTGDVTKAAGSNATTVATVGARTAASVAAAVDAVTGAANTGVGNGGHLAAYNGSGGMTFGATVTAPTFVGAFTGNVSGSAGSVAAAGIVGTIGAAQIDVAIARVANVPTNAGVGATGLWGISVGGNAATATAVGANGVGTAALQDLAVTGPKIALGTITGANIAVASLSGENLLEGYVAAEGGTLRVYVNPLFRWNSARAPVYWPGGYVDLTATVAALAAGQHVYALIEVNSTPVALGKAGNPVGGALASTDRPSKDPDTTGCAFVALAYGQTAIAQTDITQFRGTDSAEGAAGGGASMVGHVHGQSGESRVGSVGLDEGFPHATTTPSLSFLIEPMHYKTTAGVPGLMGRTLVGPIANPASGQRIIPVYFDPATVSYVQGTVSDDPTNPARPAFTGNQIPICYIHTRSGATVVKDGDDGTNAYVEDVRIHRVGGVGISSIPVAVSEGGTGVITFGAGSGLIFQTAAGGTTPLTKVGAALGAAGFSFTPAISGITAAGTVYGFEAAATVATGGTSSAVVAGLHVATPAVGGGGTQTTVYGALIDGPTYGTNRYGAWVNAGSTAAVGFVINNPSGTTADVQQYRVNNGIVGNIGPNGRMGIGAANNSANTMASVGGTIVGANAVLFSISGRENASANSDGLFGSYTNPTVASSGFTGVVYSGAYFTATRAGGDTGTIAQAAAIQAVAPPFGTAAYAAILTGGVIINGAGASFNNSGASVLGATTIGSNGFAAQDTYTALTLSGSWVSGGTTPTRRASRPEQTVFVRGLVTGGASGTQICDLGTTYPPVQMYFPAVNNNGASTVQYTSGSSLFSGATGVGVTWSLTFDWQP